MRLEIIKLLQKLLLTEDKKKLQSICKDLFEVLSQGLKLDNNQNNSLKTHFGSALSPWDSAYCLCYPMRTKKGLHALLDYLKEGKKNILYVGPGPIAPYFLFPLLLGFDAKFTLLEISPYAIQQLRKLVTVFGLEKNVEEIIETDAATWKSNKKFDVVFCLTPDVGLRREDTLPIYKNLYPQFQEAIFMPKEITIYAGFKNSNKPPEKYDSLLEAIERGYLKEEFFVENDNHPYLQNQIILSEKWILEPFESTATMPLYLKEGEYINLSLENVIS